MLIASILAPLASLLWGITNHIDKYLISKITKRGSFKGLIVFTSLVAGSILAPIYLIINKLDVKIAFLPLILIFLAASSFLLAIGLYFKALSKNETSIVITMFQLIPVFGYILGLIFLKQSLTMNQIIGGLIIIISSIAITYEVDKNKFDKNKLISLILMSLSSFFYAVYYLLFKLTTIDISFNVMTFWFQFSLIVDGLLICLLFKSYRKDFARLLINNGKKVVVFNIVNEILYSIANIIVNYAIVIAPMALVLTLNGFQPFFVFLIGVIGTKLFPKTFNEDLSKKIVVQKVICILFSIIGLAIIYI